MICEYHWEWIPTRTSSHKSPGNAETAGLKHRAHIVRDAAKKPASTCRLRARSCMNSCFTDPDPTGRPYGDGTAYCASLAAATLMITVWSFIE
jgi:hypothetical protein